MDWIEFVVLYLVAGFIFSSFMVMIVGRKIPSSHFIVMIFVWLIILPFLILIAIAEITAKLIEMWVSFISDEVR